ncbi:uncharacterized protein jeb isoform X1 [Neodiprion pinetum]|uniref:uncharacterized protein jeb isoform X1 n=1 Tax=Neodiprion pinetum TaxID=441929 RepID=UPI001EDF7911|nr:uncharacterized protein LOC124214490 isoform X1 [Neodiprion pinetum]
MTIGTLWFFSYVCVGLALAVGNRLDSPSANGVVGKEEKTRDAKLAGASQGKMGHLHLRAHQYDGSRRDAVQDWLQTYDDQTDNMVPGFGLGIGGGGGMRYRDVIMDEASQPAIGTLLPRHEQLPFLYEEAAFYHQQQQQHHARKRPGGFKQAKKVVGLPPLVYGGSEEETPPGQSEQGGTGRTSNIEDFFDQQNSRSGPTPFDNLGGLPVEPPDSPHKLQGGGIGLSPLLFDTDKPPGKRTTASSGSGSSMINQQQLPSPPGSAAIASQFMLRSARGNRQYDVPQIECPSSEDGMERFACPTPDRMGRYRCIDDHVLCDGFIDCPTGEDEDRQACMFYKTTKAHLDVLADALLRWARGR